MGLFHSLGPVNIRTSPGHISLSVNSLQGMCSPSNAISRMSAGLPGAIEVPKIARLDDGSTTVPPLIVVPSRTESPGDLGHPIASIGIGWGGKSHHPRPN